MLVGAGGAVVMAKSNGAISRSTAVAAPGLMVMAIILFMGTISGAHLNPAVTLAFAARGDFPWRRVPGYIVIQLIGATLACLFLWAVLGKLGDLGATEPGAGTSDWRAMLIELILTVGLVSTILGTASRAQNVGALSAVAVGGYIILAGFWSSPISGASMNPARSFGPDLANGDFANYWVYVVGPIARRADRRRRSRCSCAGQAATSVDSPPPAAPSTSVFKRPRCRRPRHKRPRHRRPRRRIPPTPRRRTDTGAALWRRSSRSGRRRYDPDVEG